MTFIADKQRPFFPKADDEHGQCLTKNQGIDYTKVANVLLADYRKGTLGRIT
jgi:hypothetical protein